ncbi:MAG: D-alanine--D-alanine ligase [Pseudomonadota bacterium]|uniref:D-alanine--D-alanine ligase n=1 Tax=anaerobic digester metagenome TaxID=1263854 RepID=A0A485M0S5_9ZZZZ|nr:D-alanine--D-alanine ligase [Pseudomonadota bacterium]HPD22241.1 D-alanine--D-alanine ligase [Deltaproteobacteria bacterium]HRS57074.1 D-alanine--D-alanine ligase [Desulfomonilia bacterium]HPX19601.1 D-alanine--D-alanine ligase [Deltaproteobacteria bacterium]HQA72659.1 D-alanine--D-alanine ligase [Deltaproteobacteria bacterium]
MKIGITYDLRDDYLKEGYTLEETAEFDRVDTIDAIDEAIRACGHETDRIGNAKQLVQRLARGERWDLVFNIAEGLHGVGREALVPALLDSYEIPYTFSDPLVLALTLHKGMTKAVLRDAGVPTADFAVVSVPADIEKVSLPYPLFVKPVAEGTGKGISDASLVKTPADLERVCENLLAEFHQQVLVETFLPGREFTAGVVGTGDEAAAVGVMEVLFKKKEPADLIYSYHNKSNYEQAIEYRVPEPEVVEPCAKLALSAWKVLGCRDGGRVDIRMDSQGRPNFIEVNPLAGLNPVHSDLPILCKLNGISFQELMERILKSAFKRINGGR